MYDFLFTQIANKRFMMFGNGRKMLVNIMWRM